jgi:hypothetical protein
LSDVRRILLCVVAAVAGLAVLSGCSTPIPDVTFFSSGHSVSAAPLQYCDATVKHCAPSAAPTFLTVAPGKPVQVSVPDEVAATPWQVAARFRDAKGQEYVSCSTVFGSGTRYAYSVLPPTGYQLVLVEVYSISANIAMTQTGQVIFQNSGVWSLVANPTAGQQLELPKPGDNLCVSV